MSSSIVHRAGAGLFPEAPARNGACTPEVMNGTLGQAGEEDQLQILWVEAWDKRWIRPRHS